MSEFPTIDEIRQRPNKAQLYVEAKICQAVELGQDDIEIPEHKWPTDPNFIDVLREKGYRVIVKESVGPGFWDRIYNLYTVSW